MKSGLRFTSLAGKTSITWLSHRAGPTPSLPLTAPGLQRSYLSSSQYLYLENEPSKTESTESLGGFRDVTPENPHHSTRHPGGAL